MGISASAETIEAEFDCVSIVPMSGAYGFSELGPFERRGFFGGRGAMDDEVVSFKIEPVNAHRPFVFVPDVIDAVALPVVRTANDRVMSRSHHFAGDRPQDGKDRGPIGMLGPFFAPFYFFAGGVAHAIGEVLPVPAGEHLIILPILFQDER